LLPFDIQGFVPEGVAKTNYATMYFCLKQNRRQKVVNRGALRLCGGAWHPNLTKIPLIYSVSCFNLGGLSLPSPPLPRGDLTGLKVLDKYTYECLKQ